MSVHTPTVVGQAVGNPWMARGLFVKRPNFHQLAGSGTEVPAWAGRLQASLRGVPAAVLACFVASWVPVPAAAQWIMGEGGLATTYVGAEPGTKRPVFRKLMLVAIGPDAVAPDPHHDHFAGCMRDAVVAVVERDTEWRDTLDLATKPLFTLADDLRGAGVPVDSASVGAGRRARIDSVAAVMADVRLQFMRNLASCLGPRRELVQHARLGVVNRVCLPGAARSCSGRGFTTDPGYSSNQRFAKIFEWFQNGGARAENEVVELGRDGAVVPVAITRELYEKPWPEAPDSAAVRRAFEAAVPQLRRARARFDYVVPRMLRLPREASHRLIDVIANPSVAVPGLADSAVGPDALLILSDEIARTRIVECVTLRAKRTPEDAGACAGYTLDVDLLASCMNGGRCVPPYSADGLLGPLAVTAPLGTADLVSAALLPRLPGASLDEYKRHAVGCRHEATPEAAASCVARASLAPDAQGTLDCLTRNAKDRSRAAGVAACLSDGLKEGPQRAVATCMAAAHADPKVAAICAAQGGLRPEVTEAAACARARLERKDTAGAAACAAGLSGGQPAKLARCVAEHPRDWKAATVCFYAGDGLPEGTGAVLECAGTSSDYKAFAGCVVSSGLLSGAATGDGARLLKCAAQSGGDGLGTVACMAGDSLTAEQQIALQCALQSPDPATFAVCTGGQLTVREFVKCRDRRFGDDECFGPNNEIRKLLKNVGIDIGEGTVIADLADVHLKVLQSQVAFAEHAGRELANLAEGAFKAVQDVASAVGSVANAVVSAGVSVIVQIFKAFGF